MNYNNFFMEDSSKRLTDEEFESYYAKFKQGDMAAREILINRNIGLVVSRVNNKFSQTMHDKQDLISIGIIGLVKCIDTYDITKRNTLSTYAIKCIDNEILMFLRKNKNCLKNISLDKPIDCEDKDLTLASMIADENSYSEDDAVNNITILELKEVIKSLPVREQKIIMLYFGFINNHCYNQGEIAKIFNLSQSYISRLIPKIIAKIKYTWETGSNFKHKRNNRYKTIYECLKNYSKEEIDKVIDTLPAEDKYILFLKYGTDLEHPTMSEKFTANESNIFYNLIIKKMKERLGNKINKRLKTIYEFFQEYSKEEIDKVISTLPNEDKQLLEFRYGNDLEHPIMSKEITKKEHNHFYGIIKKIKKRLGNRNQVADKRTKTIYEYFQEYSKEEIDKVISTLPNEDKQLLEFRYGNDLEHPIMSEKLNKKEHNHFYGIISKIKKRLGNRNQVADKRTKTIYEYFQEHSKEEIDKVISTLPNEDKQLLEFRYGNDLNKPHPVSFRNKNDRNNFYIKLFPKIKILLASNKIPDNQKQIPENTENIDKEAFIKTLALIRTTTFGEMLKFLTPKEAVIVCLKLGFVDNKFFSTESIANFLEIDSSEIIEITKKVLLSYRDNINQLIDNTIDSDFEKTIKTSE